MGSVDHMEWIPYLEVPCKVRSDTQYEKNLEGKHTLVQLWYTTRFYG